MEWLQAVFALMILFGLFGLVKFTIRQLVEKRRNRQKRP